MVPDVLVLMNSRWRLNRVQGKIKWINKKGSGFITTDDGREVFFHSSSFSGVSFENLTEESRLEFTLSDGTLGPIAIDITCVLEKQKEPA